jgi:hypothetical protein
MGVKSQEYSFMLKLENDEDFLVPLRGEVSRMKRSTYLSFKQYEQNVECVCEWTIGSDWSVQEVKQVSTDSDIKCFV